MIFYDNLIIVDTHSLVSIDIIFFYQISRLINTNQLSIITDTYQYLLTFSDT